MPTREQLAGQSISMEQLHPLPKWQMTKLTLEAICKSGFWLASSAFLATQRSLFSELLLQHFKTKQRSVIVFSTWWISLSIVIIQSNLRGSFGAQLLGGAKLELSAQIKSWQVRATLWIGGLQSIMPFMRWHYVSRAALSVMLSAKDLKMKLKRLLVDAH